MYVYVCRLTLIYRRR